MRTTEELRCNCQANRLLALVVYEDGEHYLHIKAHRSGRVLSEIKVMGGCEIRCVSCDRWTTIVSARNLSNS